MKKRTLLQMVAVAAAVFSIPAVALAAPNSNFTQTINNGTLSTDILNASRLPVAAPAVAMDSKAFSFDCQSSTKAFGTGTERIYISDGDVTNTSGWTLSVAATGTAADVWDDGANDFDFNDPGTAGCIDSGDADSFAGQMTINPAAGTINPDCTGCNTTGVSLGSSAAFNQGTLDSITLMSSSGSASDVWRGYLTGATISQTIPGGQTPGDYSLDLTLTVVDN